jgi:predicted RNase H-like nuclease (RuvC/YqgF family)
MKKQIKKKNDLDKNKKTVKPKKTDDCKTIDEVIKSQLNLFQFCNSLSSKNHNLALEIKNLQHETFSLKKDNEELKRILEIIGRKISELRDRMSDDESDEPNAPDPEPKKQHKKPPPLHDDVTSRCEMCEKMHHVKHAICPFCGFDKNKK